MKDLKIWQRQYPWLALVFFIGVASPWITKVIAEYYSVALGLEEVKSYTSYFSDIGSWISGTTVPIFTLISVILFYITLQMQREELSLQRGELKETKLVLESQNRTMSKQRFDSTFFNMIEIYNSIKDRIIIKNQPPNKKSADVYQGLRAITFLKKILQKDLELEILWTENITKYELINVINEKIDNLIEEFSYSIDHYFKSIYSTIYAIHINSDISVEDKVYYLNILLSYITQDEKYIIYSMGFSQYGEELREILLQYDPKLSSFVEYNEVKILYKILER